MRGLFGLLAALLCALSIALAARYGYKGADTLTDAAINAVVFGAIALCACLFDAAAVRLWFMGHRLGAAVIGFIAALALVVTFTNSLGAIASRADTTQAERVRSKDDTAENREELKRIAKARTDMPAFTPADADAVIAARAAVDAAERTRKAECGNGDPKQRGSNCRARETEEAAARAALLTAGINKAATDRAAKLDADAASIRERLKAVPPVENANPLGAALEQIVGGAAAFLTAWQQAVVAAVFELCLVGVMVIYELLGQNARGVAPAEPAALRPSAQSSHRPLFTRLRGWIASIVPTPMVSALPDVAVPPIPNAAPRIEAPRKRGANPLMAVQANAPPAQAGSVRAFVLERVVPADGEQVEMRTLLNDYRSWCRQQDVEPKDLGGFVDEIEAVCKKARIRIDTLADKRVICRNVKLAGPGAATAAPPPHVLGSASK